MVMPQNINKFGSCRQWKGAIASSAGLAGFFAGKERHNADHFTDNFSC